jgi:hypothetical protein
VRRIISRRLSRRIGEPTGVVAMIEANVKVDIKLRQIERAWTVDVCRVSYSRQRSKFLHSGEYYSSANEAYVEMKRRTMNYLRKSGRTESEQQICWHTRSIVTARRAIRNDERSLEVGAFSPSIATVRFPHFLVGIEPGELHGPLALFNAPPSPGENYTFSARCKTTREGRRGS